MIRPKPIVGDKVIILWEDNTEDVALVEDLLSSMFTCVTEKGRQCFLYYDRLKGDKWIHLPEVQS